MLSVKQEILNDWFDPIWNQTRIYCSTGGRSIHSAILAVNIDEVAFITAVDFVGVRTRDRQSLPAAINC